ncbi:hypothetical protein GCM10012284_11760 [Mangrovihabitans endophyticus]|uniref:Uncharacterized protein n=1 Tax=Mangrovihabitans endophyticus TaxID=1751298 RepID=A0A8J3BY81_9ACTN|nr:hypothetical protein GCM10012284_11760 [Mangrovihabitans endophyticus]
MSSVAGSCGSKPDASSGGQVASRSSRPSPLWGRRVRSVSTRPPAGTAAPQVHVDQDRQTGELHRHGEIASAGRRVPRLRPAVQLDTRQTQSADRIGEQNRRDRRIEHDDQIHVAERVTATDRERPDHHRARHAPIRAQHGSGLGQPRVSGGPDPSHLHGRIDDAWWWIAGSGADIQGLTHFVSPVVVATDW